MPRFSMVFDNVPTGSYVPRYVAGHIPSPRRYISAELGGASPPARIIPTSERAIGPEVRAIRFVGHIIRATKPMMRSAGRMRRTGERMM